MPNAVNERRSRYDEDQGKAILEPVNQITGITVLNELIMNAKKKDRKSVG